MRHECECQHNARNIHYQDATNIFGVESAKEGSNDYERYNKYKDRERNVQNAIEILSMMVNGDQKALSEAVENIVQILQSVPSTHVDEYIRLCINNGQGINNSNERIINEYPKIVFITKENYEKLDLKEKIAINKVYMIGDFQSNGLFSGVPIQRSYTIEGPEGEDADKNGFIFSADEEGKFDPLNKNLNISLPIHEEIGGKNYITPEIIRILRRLYQRDQEGQEKKDIIQIDDNIWNRIEEKLNDFVSLDPYLEGTLINGNPVKDSDCVKKLDLEKENVYENFWGFIQKIYRERGENAIDQIVNLGNQTAIMTQIKKITELDYYLINYYYYLFEDGADGTENESKTWGRAEITKDNWESFLKLYDPLGYYQIPDLNFDRFIDAKDGTLALRIATSGGNVNYDYKLNRPLVRRIKDYLENNSNQITEKNYIDIFLDIFDEIRIQIWGQDPPQSISNYFSPSESEYPYAYKINNITGEDIISNSDKDIEEIDNLIKKFANIPWIFQVERRVWPYGISNKREPITAKLATFIFTVSSKINTDISLADKGDKERLDKIIGYYKPDSAFMNSLP